MRRPTTSSPLKIRDGFTVLEMMIAVIALGIIMAIAIPRVAHTADREFAYAVDQVNDLLIMFAQRDNLGEKPVGLYHDYDADGTSWLLMMILEDPQDGEGQWRRDPYVKPAKLPDVVDGGTLTVHADGELVGIRELPCRLRHTPGEDRPRIEISFQSDDGEHFASLILPPYAAAPTRLEDEHVLSVRQRFDLDAAGRSREEW